VNYDKTSPTSIELYAKELIGKAFSDFLAEESETYNGKGNLGQLVEKYYFKYEPNSFKGPDFHEAGVELKVTPFKKINGRNGSYSAKERLVLNIINYNDIVNESFKTSSFLNKNKLLLIMFYLHDSTKSNKIDFEIHYTQLFEFPKEDIRIIEQDWQKIVDKIKNGKAHELSEGDTLYLGACTKGSTKEKSLRTQPFSEIKAPQRAFSLKASYMTYILRNYIIKQKATYEPIIKDLKQIDSMTFEDYVVNEITVHIGKSIEDLCKEFNVNINAKNKTSKVALKILGVNTDNAEEFEAANIKVKAIRIERTGTIKEHMSFPTFKFTEIVNELWETSEFRNLLEETRFFFIIYKFNDIGNLILTGSMFWNMPIDILDKEVKAVWNKTIETIENGVILDWHGNRCFNNLPSPSENPVAHVRPHGQNRNDSYPLPDGRLLTKQCFWLNNTFILEQIMLGLKELN
jgi:hypothetical protein